MPIRGDDQPRIGFCETGQVVKVAVMPKQKITVAIALLLRGRRNDGNAVGRLGRHLCSQFRPALCVQVGIKGHDDLCFK